jgi:FdhD protein
MARSSEQCDIWKYESGSGLVRAADATAAEEPLELRVAGRSISVTMRTPGHDAELALGFLIGEGLIHAPSDVEHVRPCDSAHGAMIDVLLASGVRVDFNALTRHVFASSSCGVCGSASIDAVCRRWPALDGGPTYSPTHLLAMPHLLRETQATFATTGGLHAAGLFDDHGRLLVAREDVGRHNAVDKVIGHAFTTGQWPLATHALMVSGRASFEIVQKAVAAGIRVVAAVSAPSSLAVDLATECGVTLIGFLREHRFNIYSHPRRIIV